MEVAGVEIGGLCAYMINSVNYARNIVNIVYNRIPCKIVLVNIAHNNAHTNKAK